MKQLRLQGRQSIQRLQLAPLTFHEITYPNTLNPSGTSLLVVLLDISQPIKDNKPWSLALPRSFPGTRDGPRLRVDLPIVMNLCAETRKTSQTKQLHVVV